MRGVQEKPPAAVDLSAQGHVCSACGLPLKPLLDAQPFDCTCTGKRATVILRRDLSAEARAHRIDSLESERRLAVKLRQTDALEAELATLRSLGQP